MFVVDALVVGHSIAYGLALRIAEDSASVMTAVSGAVNRPGTSTPARNPIALTATRPAAHTVTGHHGGPPQVACTAVTS